MAFSQTISIAAAADDGYASKTSGGYPPSGATSTTLTDGILYTWRDLNAGAFTVMVVILRFNTALLPHFHTLESVNLRATVSDFASNETPPRNLTGEWFTYTGTDSDYAQDAASTAFSGVSIPSVSTIGLRVNIPLSNIAANVNRSGYTGLRLHIDGGQPTGRNYVGFQSFETSGGTAPALDCITDVARTRLAPTGFAA